VAAPAVSVLMGVHNGAPWISRAVESVLAQTLADLELIVVDDGSTDATPGLLAAVGDPRLTVEAQPRAGLARALNRALARARAPLVARLDADDMALPPRLARQRAFLDAHPAVGLLGTAARVVDESGHPVGAIQPPEDDDAIRRALIRRNPFVHSSVMLRRALVEQVGGYDVSFAVAQDYDLWLRLSRITRMANLAEPLVVRRLVAGRVTAERDSDRLRAEVRTRWRALGSGGYPRWCAIFVARPLFALALPPALRGPLRRALRGTFSG
jgi:glycosyltransferase involved in cell wall biosynthesis